MRVTVSGERTRWVCDVCGATGEWSHGWSWYGSLAAEEGCGHIVATCSDACRANAGTLVATYDRSHALGRCRRSA